MKEKYTDDFIDNYLKGQLKQEHQTAFEKDLETDKDLAIKITKNRLIIDRIKVAGKKQMQEQIQNIDQKLAKEGFFAKIEQMEVEEETLPVAKKLDKEALLKKIKSIDQKLDKEDFFKKLEAKKETPAVVAPIATVKPPIPTHPLRMISRRMLTMAASIAILLTAGWWLFSDTAQPSLLLNDYPVAYQDVLSRKITGSTGFTGKPAYYDFLESGAKAYQNKNYKEAIEQFELYFKEAISDDTYQDFASFYTALSQINTNQIDQGIARLEVLSTQEYFELRKDAQWLAGISYLKHKKGKAASDSGKRHLKALKNDAKYGADATKILRKL